MKYKYEVRINEAGGRQRLIKSWSFSTYEEAEDYAEKEWSSDRPATISHNGQFLREIARQ